MVVGLSPPCAISQVARVSHIRELKQTKVFWFFFAKKNCLLSSVCRIDRAALVRVTLIATWYYAAFFNSPCASSDSAICTAFKAAPFRKLSLTHQNPSPFGTVGSRRSRLI